MGGFSANNINVAGWLFQSFGISPSYLSDEFGCWTTHGTYCVSGPLILPAMVGSWKVMESLQDPPFDFGDKIVVSSQISRRDTQNHERHVQHGLTRF